MIEVILMITLVVVAAVGGIAVSLYAIARATVAPLGAISEAKDREKKC